MYLVFDQSSVLPRFLILQNSPRFVYRVVAASHAPRWIRPLAIPRSAGPMRMVLLRIWPRWQRKLHQMGDALLSTAAIWVLHAEQLCLGILIQGLKPLAVLMLRLGRLIISWSRCGAGRVARTAGSGVAGEKLLSLGGGWAAHLVRGWRGRGFRGRGSRFVRDGSRLGRHTAAGG